jgi:ABC-type uncharacterized transport system ATPase component
MLIKPSTRKDKRFMAEIGMNGEGRSTLKKTIHFGAKNGNTYIDHKDKIKRQNYLKRHKVNEDWSKINAGSLSAMILWGNSTNINDNIADYKKRFNLQ